MRRLLPSYHLRCFAALLSLCAGDVMFDELRLTIIWNIMAISHEPTLLTRSSDELKIL